MKSEKLNAILEKIAAFFNTQPHASSIKDGLVAATPFTIIGGIASLIANPPISSDFDGSGFFGWFLSGWKALADAVAPYTTLINNLTLGIISVYVVFFIAYLLAQKKKINPITTSAGALLVFLLIAGPVTSYEGTNAIPIAYLDAKGMFTAMIVACVTVEITAFLFKKNVKIHLPESVPPMVSAPFEALIPFIINIIVFLLVDVACISLTAMHLPALILSLFMPLVSASDTIWAAIIYALLINALWFLGIHGANVVGTIMNPFFLINLTANLDAVNAGQAMESVLASNWNIIACNFGGVGSALAIVIASLIVARSKYVKSIIKIGGIPAIFNISEPITFGLPVMLNTYLFIPLLLVPIMNSAVMYLLMDFDIIGRIFISVPWTLPSPIAAYFATLDIKAAIAVVVLLVIDVLIYIPFIKKYDQTKLVEESGKLTD